MCIVENCLMSEERLCNLCVIVTMQLNIWIIGHAWWVVGQYLTGILGHWSPTDCSGGNRYDVYNLSYNLQRRRTYKLYRLSARFH